MRIIVLGAGAGGGFPQWNCCCENCRLAWAGDPAADDSARGAGDWTGKMAVHYTMASERNVLTAGADGQNGGAEDAPGSVELF